MAGARVSVICGFAELFSGDTRRFGDGLIIGSLGNRSVEFWKLSVIALNRELAMSVTSAKALVSSKAETPDTLLPMYKELSEFERGRLLVDAGLTGDKSDSTFPSRP